MTGAWCGQKKRVRRDDPNPAVTTALDQGFGPRGPDVCRVTQLQRWKRLPQNPQPYRRNCHGRAILNISGQCVLLHHPPCPQFRDRRSIGWRSLFCA